MQKCFLRTYRSGLCEPVWTQDLKVQFAQLADLETNVGALGDGDDHHHWLYLYKTEMLMLMTFIRNISFTLTRFQGQLDQRYFCKVFLENSQISYRITAMSAFTIHWRNRYCVIMLCVNNGLVCCFLESLDFLPVVKKQFQESLTSSLQYLESL